MSADLGALSPPVGRGRRRSCGGLPSLAVGPLIFVSLVDRPFLSRLAAGLMGSSVGEMHE